MPPSPGRALRPAAFAVLIGTLTSVGCLNTDESKEPLALGQDTRTRLVGGTDATAAKTPKVAAFDPTATGGSGLSVQNSFNRTVPGPGTGTTTGNFASHVPPSQVGLPPTVSPPPLQGASYGEPASEPGRTSMTRAATPPPAPLTPLADASPPKLDPPSIEPPVRPATFSDPPAPVAPIPVRPAMPDSDKGTSLVPVTPIPPVSTIAPVAPLPLPATPGVAPNEPLPVAPAAPVYVPSPTEVPIPGVQAVPKLPPAPPIRPQ